MGSKGTAVNPLSTLSDCRLLNLKDGRSASGKILKLHLGGVSVFTNFELKPGTFLRVTFFDDVTSNVITVFVRVQGRMFRVREWLKFFSHRRLRKTARFYGTAKPREYFAKMCNVKKLPEEYRAVMDRIEKDGAAARVVRRAGQSAGRIEFKVASTAAEKEAAWRLAYAEAVRRTGAAHSDNQLLITDHLLLPTTATIVGKRGGEVVLTLTCTADTPFGLPLDDAHRNELTELRKDSGLVEFGLFGIREDAFVKFGFLERGRDAAVKELFKFAVRYAAVRGASRAVTHAGLIDAKTAKRFGFRELGSKRQKTFLEKPLAMDLKKAARGFAKGKIDAYRIATPNAYTMRDLFYLFVEQSNLASRLTQDQRRTLAQMHPHLAEWFHALPTLLLYT